MPRKAKKAKTEHIPEREIEKDVASSSKIDTTEVPQSVAEIATEVVAKVVETVKEAADVEMESASQAVSHVAEAASQFVETMNGDSVEAPQAEGSDATKATMTPEERRQKLDGLRKRMVCYPSGFVQLLLII
jgi:hypothetical protein